MKCGKADEIADFRIKNFSQKFHPIFRHFHPEMRKGAGKWMKLRKNGLKSPFRPVVGNKQKISDRDILYHSVMELFLDFWLAPEVPLV